MPEEAAGSSDVGELEAMIGGGEAAVAEAGKPGGDAAPEAAAPEATPEETAGETVGEPDAAAAEEPAPDGAGEEAPSEESPAPEEIVLPDGVESAQALLEERARLLAENEAYRRAADGRARERPAEPRAPAERKPGRFESMSKDQVVRAFEDDHFSTHSAMTVEALRNTEPGQVLLNQLVDMARDEAIDEVRKSLGPLVKRLEPTLMGSAYTEMAKDYPRFEEFRPRVEAEVKRTGKDPKGIFFEMLAKDNGKPAAPGSKKVVAQAAEALRRAKAASTATAASGLRAPAPPKAEAPDALDEMIGVSGEIDPMTGAPIP